MPRTANPRSRLMAELRDAQAVVRDAKKLANSEYDAAVKQTYDKYVALVGPAEKRLNEIIAAAQAEYDAAVGPAKAEYHELSQKHETLRKEALDAAEKEAARMTDEAYQRYDKSR